MKPSNYQTTSRQQPYLVFMLLLSVFALAVLGIETLSPPDEGTREILEAADTLVCGLFFMDFIISLRQAKNKAKYFVTWGWLDLLSSVPTIELFRLARTARIARIVRVLRGIRAARVLSLFIVERRTQSTLLAAALLSIVLVAISAIAVLHFEAAVDSSIKTGEDAIWWAMSTITTAGYGDKVPVSPEGRMLALGLMVAGVGMFAILSGVFASWFMAPEQEEREDEMMALKQELAEIKKMLAAMKEKDAS